MNPLLLILIPIVLFVLTGILSLLKEANEPPPPEIQQLLRQIEEFIDEEEES